MKLRRVPSDNIILIAGAIVFIWILLLPKPVQIGSYYDSIKHASATLKGQTPFSDFAAEVVGFRALYYKTDPYPVLGPALKGLGIDWNVTLPHSHPPTSYLFAAPVAFLPWPWASAVWAWLMLGLIVLTYYFYGLSWKKAVGLMPFTLLWPPASIALGQVTILWMFGLAMAYYFRRRQPLWSGVSIGLASATKLFAGIVIGVFLLKRKWTAVLGFLSIWIVMLGVVSLLNSQALPQYFAISRPVGLAIIARSDNQSPIIVSYRYGGLIGVAFIALLFWLIIFANRKYLHERQTFPTTRAWMILTYFSVALLPTSYIYALIPLLPVIVFLISVKKIATTILSLYCILIPCIYVQGGDQSVLPMASVSWALGLAFILDLLPVKIFQKKWRLNLPTLAGGSFVKR